jgi:hypothetical protein
VAQPAQQVSTATSDTARPRRTMDRSFLRFLVVVAILAFAIRLVYSFTLARDVLGAGDSIFYHRVANLLADGHGFMDPFRYDEGVVIPTANHPPLYPLFLSAFSWLGMRSTSAHRALGALTGATSVALVGVLGLRMAGARIGRVAAVIAAFSPVVIAIDGAVMSESLYGVWVVGALLAGLALVERPTSARAALLGGLVGLAALTRSDGLAMIVLVSVPAIWLARQGLRKSLVLFLLATVACAAVIAPWTIRNQDAFGQLVPLTTNDASLLKGANCPLVYSGSEMGLWTFDCVLGPVVSLDEAVQADEWRGEALEYIGDNLDRLPAVIGVRVLRTWGLWEPRPELDEGVPIDFARVSYYTHLAILPIAIYGTVIARRRRVPLWPVLAAALLVTAVSAIGWGVNRFRHALDLPLCVLVAIGLVAIYDGIVARRRSGPAHVAADDEEQAPALAR